MKKLIVRLEFKVPDATASSFTKLLVARMHKYLAKHSVEVNKVDTEILSSGQKEHRQ